MKKKILILGAGGFLGVHLLGELSQHKEYEIWAVSSKKQMLEEHFKNENIRIVSRQWPFTDEFKKQDFSCAINCAYPRNVNGFEVAEGLDYIEKIYKAFRDGNVKSIINISSQSVYDNKRNETATEESSICLDTPYAVGKYMVEKLLNNICCDIPHTNIRMASLIGPGFDQRFVNKLIKNVLEMEPIKINVSNKKYSFLDIKDAAKGIASLLELKPSCWKIVYNLGNEDSFSVEEITNIIINVCDERGICIPKITRNEIHESGSSAISSNLLMNDTGFKCSINMKGSITMILEDLLSFESHC